MSTKKYNKLANVADKLNYNATNKRGAVKIRADQERLNAIRSKFKNNINSANHRPARSEVEKRISIKRKIQKPVDLVFITAKTKLRG